jgi:hypothetical protein
MTPYLDNDGENHQEDLDNKQARHPNVQSWIVGRKLRTEQVSTCVLREEHGREKQEEREEEEQSGQGMKSTKE